MAPENTPANGIGLGDASCSSGAPEDTRELRLPFPVLEFHRDGGDETFCVPLPRIDAGHHYLLGRFGRSWIGEEGLELIPLNQLAPDGWKTACVSSSHARLWRDQETGAYLIKDEQSKNGTYGLEDGEDGQQQYVRMPPGKTYELRDKARLKLPSFATIIFRIENPQIDDSALCADDLP